jgi:O-glycosyl hydrolase
MHPRALRCAVVATLPFILSLVAPLRSAQAQTTSITIDGSKGGRTFDGVGAISGGGGNSRLLIDYPEPQRSQILDYLFKPGFGAAVQILKIEIGGDSNSTDGAEPSVEHAKGQVNCDVGYEFWIAEQAKARNPGIKLVGLAWAAPGWIGNGNYWTHDSVEYIVTWLGCAKSHGLTIDYLGGRNEKGHNKGWYEDLNTTLADRGFGSIQIVADDSVGWKAADDMVADPDFDDAVDIVGVHYPCGYKSPSTTCNSTANAIATGKQLWASENGSLDVNSGAPALIRSITRGYIDGRMTAYLNWPLVAALTPNLPFATVGLAVAPSPWSGSYRLGKETWAIAQVSQFTRPGWKFIDSATGFLGGDRANGSFIALKSPNAADYSLILETTSATAAQSVTVRITGRLPLDALHVWTTDLNSSDTADHFVRQADVKPSNGQFSLTLQPGRIYSLTTLGGQGKGTVASPAAHSLALPYRDNFDSYAIGSEAKYVADMQGSFEVRACADGHAGRCVQQVAPRKPILWEDAGDAFALAGDTAWTNYSVSIDVDLQQAGTVKLVGRANTQKRPSTTQAGYELRISDTGAWTLAKNDTAAALTTLASGTTSALGLHRWHTLTLDLVDSTITARLDGSTLATVLDASYPSGQVAFGVVGYQTDLFDNLSVSPRTGRPPTKGTVASGIAGKCLAVQGSAVRGAPVVIDTCDDRSATQSWTATAGTLQLNGLCLDVTGKATVDGTLVELWTCNGQTNQLWAVGANGSLVGAASGKCLDDPGSSTADGTQQVIWTCNGGNNQRWTLPD